MWGWVVPSSLEAIASIGGEGSFDSTWSQTSPTWVANDRHLRISPVGLLVPLAMWHCIIPPACLRGLPRALRHLVESDHPETGSGVSSHALPTPHQAPPRQPTTTGGLGPSGSAGGDHHPLGDVFRQHTATHDLKQSVFSREWKKWRRNQVKSGEKRRGWLEGGWSGSGSMETKRDLYSDPS